MTDLKGLIDAHRYGDAWQLIISTPDLSRDGVRYEHLDGIPILSYLVRDMHFDLYKLVVGLSLNGKYLPTFPEMSRARDDFPWFLHDTAVKDPMNDWLGLSLRNSDLMFRTRWAISCLSPLLYQKPHYFAELSIHTDDQVDVFCTLLIGARSTTSDIPTFALEINRILPFLNQSQCALLYSIKVGTRSVKVRDMTELQKALLSVAGLTDNPQVWRAYFTSENFTDVRNMCFEYQKRYQTSLDEQTYVEALTSRIQKSTDGSFTSLLTSGTFPLFQKYLSCDVIGEIAERAFRFHLNSFRFKDFLFIYFKAHRDVRSFDKFVQQGTETGFAVAGSSNFEKFLRDLNEGVVRILSQVGDADSIKLRVGQFLDLFLSIYADIRPSIAYTETIAAQNDLKDYLALATYSVNSSEANEPFKSETFTETQDSLSAARRRPTDEQYRVIETLDRLIGNAPRTTRALYAWRGVAVPSFEAIDLHLDIFKSVSLSPTVSYSYMRDLKCCFTRVLIPAGVPLLALDPVQEYKMNGGLYEFLLPRGATFKFLKTFQLGHVTVYDCAVHFDDNYQSHLAIGRLRRQR